MATRLQDPRPVFTNDAGTILAGGSLTFSDTGTTTARNVFAEAAGTTNLGAVITLNSAGRVPSDVWLLGPTAYRVVVKDSVGATVRTMDDCRDIQSATSYTLPNPASGTSGQVIQTNGTVYSLASIFQVPDPAGSAGKLLSNDGANIIWAAATAATVYTSTSLPGGIVQTATSFQIGKFLVQTGSCTAPSVSTLQTSVTVTFPTAYATLLHVGLTPSVAGIVDGGGESGVTASAISRSTVGFTASFYLGLDHASDHRIASAVTATWFAFGIVA